MDIVFSKTPRERVILGRQILYKAPAVFYKFLFYFYVFTPRFDHLKVVS